MVEVWEDVPSSAVLLPASDQPLCPLLAQKVSHQRVPKSCDQACIVTAPRSAGAAAWECERWPCSDVHRRTCPLFVDRDASQPSTPTRPPAHSVSQPASTPSVGHSNSQCSQRVSTHHFSTLPACSLQTWHELSALRRCLRDLVGQPVCSLLGESTGAGCSLPDSDSDSVGQPVCSLLGESTGAGCPRRTHPVLPATAPLPCRGHSHPLRRMCRIRTPPAFPHASPPGHPIHFASDAWHVLRPLRCTHGACS